MKKEIIFNEQNFNKLLDENQELEKYLKELNEKIKEQEKLQIINNKLNDKIYNLKEVIKLLIEED